VPAFHALRQQFFEDELVLLYDAPIQGRVAASEVSERLGVFDRITSYRAGNGFRSWTELAVCVRKLNPDRLVVLPQLMDRAPSLTLKKAFFRILGVPKVLGLSDPKNAFGGLTEAKRLLALLKAEGLAAEHLGYGFPVHGVAAARVQEWSAEKRKGRAMVVFCGGGKTAAQRWGWDRYCGVLMELERRYGVFVVGVGTERERQEACGKVLGRVPGMEWIPEGWSVPELIELMRGAELYVGNDTGPMHVAAAVGCPVFVVMSARNPLGAWDPDVEPRCVVRLRMDCEGCFVAECPIPGQPCLSRIEVDQANQTLVEFVEAHRLFKEHRSGKVRDFCVGRNDTEGRGRS
jgi:ADP-heptose:LPS heptosyltransferase